MRRYVQVAVPVPLHRPFTYILPEGLDVRPGLRVEVPFGPRKLIGMVCGEPSETPSGDVAVSKLKPIHSVLDAEPLLPQDVLSLSRWLADYYHAPPGEAYLRTLPPKLGGGRGKGVKEHTFKTQEVVSFVRLPSASERIGAKMDAALTWLSEAKQATMQDIRDATSAGRTILSGIAP